MCRWMAYSGTPILAEELLFRPAHSIIDQSLHSRMGATTTNGDGFGIGWYGEGAEPALFKEHRAGVERQEPARAGGSGPYTAAVRPHQGVDRNAGAALQLPPLPP